MTSGMDEPQGPGWWKASNGKFYPPTRRPKIDVSAGHQGPASAPLGPDWWLAGDGKWYPAAKADDAIGATLPDLRDRMSSSAKGSVDQTRSPRSTRFPTPDGTSELSRSPIELRSTTPLDSSDLAESSAPETETSPVGTSPVGIGRPATTGPVTARTGFVARDMTAPRLRVLSDEETNGALARRSERPSIDNDGESADATLAPPTVVGEGDARTAHPTQPAPTRSHGAESTAPRTPTPTGRVSTGDAMPVDSSAVLPKADTPSGTDPQAGAKNDASSFDALADQTTGLSHAALVDDAAQATPTEPKSRRSDTPSDGKVSTTDKALGAPPTQQSLDALADRPASRSHQVRPSDPTATEITTTRPDSPRSRKANLTERLRTDRTSASDAAPVDLPPPPKQAARSATDQPAPVDLSEYSERARPTRTTEVQDSSPSYAVAPTSALGESAGDEAHDLASPPMAADAATMALGDLPSAPQAVLKTATPTASKPRGATSTAGKQSPESSIKTSPGIVTAGEITKTTAGAKKSAAAPSVSDETIDLRRTSEARPARPAREPEPRVVPATPSRAASARDVVERTGNGNLDPEGPRRAPVIILALGIVAALGVIAFLLTRDSSNDLPNPTTEVSDSAEGASDPQPVAGDSASEPDPEAQDPAVTSPDELSFSEEPPEPGSDEALVGTGDEPVPFGSWGLLAGGDVSVRVTGLSAAGVNPPTPAGQETVSIGVEVVRSGAGDEEPVEATWRLLSTSNAIYTAASSGCGGTLGQPSDIAASDTAANAVLCWSVSSPDAAFDDLVLLVQTEADEFPNVLALSGN